MGVYAVLKGWHDSHPFLRFHKSESNAYGIDPPKEKQVIKKTISASLSFQASTPCNLCGTSIVKTLSTKGRRNESLRTVICLNCGLVWSDPLPFNPREFYENEYRMNYKGTYKPKLKHIVRAGKVALFRYEYIRKRIPQGSAILDVGSGGGEFSYLLKKRGFKIKGIEPNLGYADYSIDEYGLDVQKSFIQDANLAKESFDVITIWHVLEHTENPARVLDTLYEALKPGGVIIIEVPNIEAVCQSPSSTFHFAHIFNFNDRTLQLMTKKSGFSLLSMEISKDGGNLTFIMQKPIEHTNHISFPISQSENADRIMRIIEQHTLSRYWCSHYPYTRMFRRIIKMIMEKISTRNYSQENATGKKILDDLYQDNICSSLTRCSRKSERFQ